MFGSDKDENRQGKNLENDEILVCTVQITYSNWTTKYIFLRGQYFEFDIY